MNARAVVLVELERKTLLSLLEFAEVLELDTDTLVRDCMRAGAYPQRRRALVERLADAWLGCS